MTSFMEAILREKVARICSHVGYNAITVDSTNILVDIYRRTIMHLARHCKEAANNNRRVEPTLIDLVQAYDFVGISIPELQDHIQSVKLPFEKEIQKDDTRPSNRIPREMLVDDLLEAKKNKDSGGHDEDGENKSIMDERSVEEENVPSVPLLKDVYQEIANQYPSPSEPVKANKMRIKREEKPAIPKLKITPLDPAVAEPPSFLPLLEGSKDDRSFPISIKTSQTPPPVEKKRGPKPKTKTKLSKTALKQKTKLKSKLKTKLKTKAKSKGRGREPKPSPVVESKEIVSPAALKLPNASPSPASPPQSQPIQNPEPALKIRTPTPAEEPIIKTPTLSAQSSSSTKLSSKGKKKKKKSNNRFAIVTESVTAKADAEETDWFCPACKEGDNGDVMLQCEGPCELWFHLKCTGLKKVPKDDEHWECNQCLQEKSNLPTPNKQSSKSSKKRIKVSHSTHVKMDIKTPTPQPPSPSPLPKILKSETPSPPPAPSPQVIQTPVEAQAFSEQEPQRPAVVGTSSDDLCPECQLPDDGTLMIQCDDPFCAKWFHGKCVNVLSAPEDNDSWFCKVCVDKQQSAFKRRRRVK